tara:strand:- start:87900 stop:88457 length:558 start_codon:yes stop_codon:yes gene_type:complete
VCLIGPSGSGKSSLISIMGGLEKPTKGSVLVNNKNITELDESKLAEFRKQNIGIVFQSFHLLPNLTAIENVELPLQLLKSDRIKQLSSEALKKVGLSSRENHLPSQLSGGEQQRVALARAFIGSPKIILADEPTGNLDSKSSSMIIDMLFSLKEENKTTLIFATHDERLSKKCDRITEIKDGKIF